MFQNEYEKAADDYNPHKIEPSMPIKCLLVAESPPPEGYFYFSQPSKDNLFENVMKVLFSEDQKLEDWKLNKTHFLRKFQKCGFFLIDVYRRPLKLMRPEEIRKDAEGLLERIQNLAPMNVVVIGERADVVVYLQKDKLNKKQINVVNMEPKDFIPLPMRSNKRKEEFRQKFGEVLNKNGLLPR